MSEWRNRKNWAQTRTLYVVLQGEFALYREPTGDPIHDTLHILAPRLDDHVYLGGPWLTDWENVEPLPERLYLRKAIGDRKQNGEHCCRSIPEKNGDIFMRIGDEELHAENARLHITAPMPIAILPGLLEPEDGTTITVTRPTGPPIVVPPVATVIPILVYKWFADHRPFLEAEPGGDDECAGFKMFSGGPSDDFQSLHIYATSLEPETAAHAKYAFHAAAELIGVDAVIDFPNDQKPLIPATPPAGLSYAQVNWFLSQIVKVDPWNPLLLRDRLDPWEGPQIEYNRLLAGPSTNCGPITGGR